LEVSHVWVAVGFVTWISFSNLDTLLRPANWSPYEGTAASDVMYSSPV